MIPETLIICAAINIEVFHGLVDVGVVAIVLPPECSHRRFTTDKKYVLLGN